MKESWNAAMAGGSIMGMPSIGRFWPWLTRLGSTARGCSPGFPRSQFFPMSPNVALPRALTCADVYASPAGDPAAAAAPTYRMAQAFGLCACDPGDYGDL